MADLIYFYLEANQITYVKLATKPFSLHFCSHTIKSIKINYNGKTKFRISDSRR